MLVPMIATIVPGAGHGHRRRRDVRVDVRDRDRRPGHEARPGGGPLGEAARPVADRDDPARHLLVDDVLEARIERGEVVRGREAVALRPDRLVAGRAGVARLDAGELPDDPVGRLDQPVGRVVDLGRLVEDLERLREEPLGRDLAAVAGEPRLAPLGRDRVDPVGLRLRGVVLPELDPGVRVAAEAVDEAERRAVGDRRQHRARGEVDADADDVRGVDARLGEERRHGFLERPDVVLGILERPVGLEAHVVVGRRQVLVDHAVPVCVDGGRELAAVGDSRRARPARTRSRSRSPIAYGPAHRSARGSTTTFRPRRSTR